MRILVVTFACIFLFMNCEEQIPVEIQYNLQDTVVIKTSQMAIFENEQIAVSFDKVQSDSRCPSDVVCVWSGEASVQLTLQKTTDDYSFELSTLDELPYRNDTLIAGFMIRLLDLLPYPDTRVKADPEGYKALLIISQ